MLQLDVGDLAVAELDVHRPLALDPGQGADVQDVAAVGELVVHGFASSVDRGSCRSLSRRNASDAALKVRKTRITSGSLMPWIRSRVAIEAVLGVSCGPKQP